MPGDVYTTYDALSFADWKPYTNPRSKKSGWISEGGQVRYDDPSKADAEKAQKRGVAEDAVTRAVNSRGQLKSEEVPALREHMRTLTRDKKRELARRLGLKVGGLKDHLIQRLVAHVGGKPQPVIRYGYTAKDTLLAAVKQYGGIDPKSLAFLASYSGVKHAIEDGINLGAFKAGGRGLDVLAQELTTVGHLVTPDDRVPTEYLLEQLKEGARTRRADTTAQYESVLDEYYRAQQEAEQEAANDPAYRSAVEEALRSGGEQGRTRGRASGVGGRGAGVRDDRDRGKKHEDDIPF